MSEDAYRPDLPPLVTPAPLNFEEEPIAPEDAAVLDELRNRGHQVDLDGPWSHGQVTAVARERNGVLSGAASPRGRVAYVMGR